MPLRGAGTAPNTTLVMRGLDPRIHPSSQEEDGCAGSSPAMTPRFVAVPALRCTAEQALHRIRDTITSRNPRGDLAAQALQAEQGVGAGFRDFDALDDEMLAEEIQMHRAFVELLRRQHRREDRHLGAQ